MSERICTNRSPSAQQESWRDHSQEKDPLLASLLNSKLGPRTVAYGTADSCPPLEEAIETQRGWPASGQCSGSQKTSDTVPSGQARVVLFLVVFFYTLGMSVLTPLNAQYLQDVFRPSFINDSSAPAGNQSSPVACDADSSDPVVQQQDKLQEYVAQYLLYLSVAKTAPMVIATPLLGAASDAVGRRGVFFLSTLTLLLTQSFFAVLVWFSLDVRYLLVSSALSGASGEFCAFLLALFAYTADLTPLAGRARTLGIVVNEFVIRISSTIGTLAIGYIIENLGYFYASLVPVAGFSLAAVCLCCLPETVSRHRRAGMGVNPVTYARKTFAFYFSAGTRQERRLFRVSYLLLIITFVFMTGLSGVFVLYQRNAPFCWDPEQVGQYGAASMAVQASASVVVTRLLQTCLSDPTIFIVSLLSRVGQLVVIGLAQSDFMIYSSVAAAFLCEASTGIIRSIMSKMAEPGQQGALFASIAVTEAVCSLASTTIYNTVYKATVERMRGAVFLMMAGLAGADVVCTLFFIKMAKNGERTSQKDIQDTISHVKIPQS